MQWVGRIAELPNVKVTHTYNYHRDLRGNFTVTVTLFQLTAQVTTFAIHPLFGVQSYLRN
jgi:hypothetical protein